MLRVLRVQQEARVLLVLKVRQVQQVQQDLRVLKVLQVQVDQLVLKVLKETLVVPRSIILLNLILQMQIQVQEI